MNPPTTITKTPSISSKLLFFKQQGSLSRSFRSSLAIIRKKQYKYLHSLHVSHVGRSFKKDTYKLKHLRSLDSIYDSRKDLYYHQQFAKRFQKSLKSISEILKRPKIQVLLPLLTEFGMIFNDYDAQEKWRIVLTRSSFKKLAFYFGLSRPSSHGAKTEEFSQKHKAQFSRHLQKMKTLKEMRLSISFCDLKFTEFLLKFFGEKMPISLSVSPIYNQTDIANFQNLTTKTTEFSKALQNITQLESSCEIWYSTLYSIGKFENLAALHLTFSSNYRPSNCQDLSYFQTFQNLQKVKNFTLYFHAKATDHEKDFLKNLTLPPATEHLQLTMKNFALSDIDLQKMTWKKVHDNLKTDPLYVDFYEKFTNCPNLKNFSFTLNGNYSITKECPEIFGTFAGLIFQKLTKLEKMRYTHWISPKKAKATMIKPLDFETFWSRLLPSKDTFQSIWLDGTEILFPEQISQLEMNFPRLDTLKLRGKILEPTMFGPFACKLSSSSHVTSFHAEELVFKDAKNLTGFFENIQEIPMVMKAETWKWNVSGIKQEVLIDCLKRFIEKEDIKGQFEWCFKYVPITNAEDFKEVFKLALKKKWFYLLRIEGRGFEEQVLSWENPRTCYEYAFV